ncbi:MAG: sigma 54-interacting transcriptional regulator [Candidatus Zixiibacteriota bacterium]
MKKDEDEKQAGKKTYKKPAWSEFEKEVRKKIISYGHGLEQVYKDIYTSLDLDPSQVILITGKSGVGKELVADAIQSNSERKDKPFVKVNSSAFPETLLESELFGYVRGAFTGALKDKKGKFEQADGGSLFLDEVGDMSPQAQAKLLRVIEDKEIVRVGESKRPMKVDVKIIAATNKELRSETANGKFRDDLYQRLKGFLIQIPLLRERPLDIPVLMRWFIGQENERTHKNIDKLSLRLLFFCINHDWTGNVRELRGFIKTCHANCPSGNVMDFQHGERYFMDDKFPDNESPETAVIHRGSHQKAIVFSKPAAYIFAVLGWAVEHDREKLKELMPFKVEKLPEDLCRLAGCRNKEYFKYEDIRLDSIPESRGYSYEVFAECPHPENSRIFWQKVKDRKKLTEDEEKILDWWKSNGEAYKRMSEQHTRYEKRVLGLKALYDRNLMSMLWSKRRPVKGDLFAFPYKEAMFEFEKEWIRRGLERNNGNKTKTAREMGISVETFRQKLKKPNL